MSGITLANKEYVDKLAARQFYYDGNIYKEKLSPSPGPFGISVVDHEFNINTKFDKSGFIYSIDLMAPSVSVPPLDNAAFIGLLKSGNSSVKVGDIKNESAFLLKSKEKYTNGFYSNIIFKTNMINYSKDIWPVGPDSVGWSGWYNNSRESGFTSMWEETENKDEYICVAVDKNYGIVESLMQSVPYKQIKNNLQIRGRTYPNTPIQFTTRMCVQFDIEAVDESKLVTTAYVNSAFGLTGGSSDLASVEYVDEINKLREVWPKEYYPYQPDLTIE